jgi:hypothetical protein
MHHSVQTVTHFYYGHCILKLYFVEGPHLPYSLFKCVWVGWGGGRVEPRDSCMLGKSSANELQPELFPCGSSEDDYTLSLDL